MNALDIIEQVREHDAELVVEENKLIVRGKGERLPEDLHAALREHKAEIMVALGAPFDAAIASILDEMRPYLPPAVKRLSDRNLLALVNWSMVHAWNKAAASLKA